MKISISDIKMPSYKRKGIVNIKKTLCSTTLVCGLFGVFRMIQNLKLQIYYPILKNRVLSLWT